LALRHPYDVRDIFGLDHVYKGMYMKGAKEQHPLISTSLTASMIFLLHQSLFDSSSQ
jgi:hypothetical protein